MRKSYYIRFNHRGQKREVRLRLWARENPQYFPRYRFTNTQDDHPTTHEIRDYCVRNLNARIDENQQRVILYMS
jgi:hypothetical protein